MERICPITYTALRKDEEKYSLKGIHLLSKSILHLGDFPYTTEEQQAQAIRLASKLSIQGVQPKLSVVFDASHETFTIKEKGGTFIMKPQSILWPHLPENEDLTMRLAKAFGLLVPLHGLIYCKDGRMSYWIKRFDRASLKTPLKHKIPVEDFAQLSGENRQTKYESSMEKVAKIIEKFTTFPALEKEKLFHITLFNFLVGNEDMHLKNFSLICRDDKITLSPSYDLVNTTLAMGNLVEEEIALPIRGKKRKLAAHDFFDYFGRDVLALQLRIIDDTAKRLRSALPLWESLIERSFLPPIVKNDYRSLVIERFKRLALI